MVPPGFLRGLRCILILVCIGAALSLLLLCTTWAQDAGEQVHITPRKNPSSGLLDTDANVLTRGKPMRVGVDVVLVPVTVTDNRNRPVIGLQKQDFALFENDEAQEIRYFSSEDAPISIGVLLDLSRSMTNKIDNAREALGEFFKTANPDDDYFVVTFADRPELLADSTQSVGSIQAKLAGAKPSGHTALLDAIYLGISKLRRARYSRRALLILSDGGDNHSRYRKTDIRRLVEEADVEIYAIGIYDRIFKTPEEWGGKRLLIEITEATGGRTITLDNPRQLPDIAATVSQELRSQYVLGYHLLVTARREKWRKIKVKLAAADPAMHVYSKKGYWGPE